MKRPLLLLACALSMTASAAVPVTISFYYPTGKAPYCRGKVKNLPVFRPWHSVALSHDLLRKYPCGTRLLVRFDKSLFGTRMVYVTVQDRTAARFSNRVDMLVSPGENAHDYGLRSGSIR